MCVKGRVNKSLILKSLDKTTAIRDVFWENNNRDYSNAKIEKTGRLIFSSNNNLTDNIES